jgi:adenylate cyclase
MGIEIERKFLVRSDAWRGEAEAGVRYRQGYLCGSERASVRVRSAGDAAWLTVKGATDGVSRSEHEYPIPPGDADELLALCGEALVDKTRYHVRHGGHTWEVDEFHGANAGLVLAEIELDAPDAAFPRPGWLGEEVSHDRRYYNASLARHPWGRW